MKIVFLRHGESMGNVWGNAYADDATNFLSLKGVKQAELAAYDIAEYMPDIDVVYLSELTRARQTGITVTQSMGDWKRDYVVDGRLNEWCWMADGGITWFEAEKSRDFWNRMDDFYHKEIYPHWDDEITMLITSHYYTMHGIFQLIRETLGMENVVHRELDPQAHSDIPNSVPFYFDSQSSELPQMLLSGYKNR